MSTELEFVLNSYRDPVFERARFVEVRRKLAASELSTSFTDPRAR